MATQARINANRRNAQRSTGPKTTEGKNQSRFNAVKHGMSAALPVLPGEDPQAYQQRIETWKAELLPRNSIETYLAERAAQVSWQIDRADRAQSARLASQFRRAAQGDGQKNDDQVAELGRQLFFDPRGPIALYPHSAYRPGMPRISWTGEGEDPPHPSLIVSSLESTEAGCEWLLARWAELKNLLDTGLAWHGPDKLKAIRLLGKHPIDAVDDNEIATVFLACHVIDPRGGEVFHEIWNEVNAAEATVYKQRLAWREIESLKPAERIAAFKLLSEVVQNATDRLEARLLEHQDTETADEAELSDHLAFDDSLDGERLRRYQIAANRNLLRTLDTVLKLRRCLQSDTHKNHSQTSDSTRNATPDARDPSPHRSPVADNSPLPPDSTFPTNLIPTMPVIASSSASDPYFSFSTGIGQALDPLLQFVAANRLASSGGAEPSGNARNEPGNAHSDLQSIASKIERLTPEDPRSGTGTVPRCATAPGAQRQASGSGIAPPQSSTPPIPKPAPDRAARVSAFPHTSSVSTSRPADRKTTLARQCPQPGPTQLDPGARKPARATKVIEISTCSMDDAKLRPLYLRRQPTTPPAHSPGRNDCSSAVASTSGR